MRLVSIPVNKEVVSVDTGDFNGDGKPDLVFYGTPAEVEILYQRGQRAFRQSQEDQYRRRRPEAGGPGRGGLRPGRPRRPALLAEKELIFVYQTAPGSPERARTCARIPRAARG